jgi:hypothetical protein
MPLQVRRGPTADRLSITPKIGELIFDTEEQVLYVGDGVTPGGVSGADFTAEEAQDAAAELFTLGTHSNISFTYDSANKKINSTVDLSNYTGTIQADVFKGNVVADDSTILIDATLASFNLNETIRSDLIPFDDELYDLGSPTKRFNTLYLSGSSLFLSNAEITAIGSTINLPAGSTVDGVLIGTGTGNGTGDGVIVGNNYQINIIGEDSTILVNSSDVSINLNGTIKDNVVPSANENFDLGSPTNRFKDLYLSGNSLFLGDAQLTAVGSAVNLPAGSTVDGINLGAGIVDGSNYQINIIGGDSSLIVDASNNSINAPGGISGDLSGSVIGDDLTTIVDATSNSINAPGGISGDLTGSVIGDNLTTIVDATNNSINAPGGISGDLSGSVIGDDLTTIVDASNSSINAPGGISGDLTGSVISDDFTILVDSTNNSFNAPGGISGDLTGSVFGTDSSIIVNADSNSISALGGITGNVQGDLVGSVFADDEFDFVPIINAANREFIGKLGGDLDVDIYRIVGNSVFIAPEITTAFGSQALNRNGSISISNFSFAGGTYEDGIPLKISHTHNNSAVDRQVFYRARVDGLGPAPVISGDRIGEISFVGDTTDPIGFSQYSASFRVVVDGANSGNNAPGRFEFLTNPGTGLQQSCQITGNGTLKVNRIESLGAGSLSITGDLTGSVFSDDSTKVVDGISGAITAGSFVQFGSLTATERNALTAVNGMVIYNTTYNRFEGYQNGSWINLDDGTAAGA